LTILLVGMIARAASGTFEWFYPLRFFAAVAVVWHFRRRYQSVEWKWGWHAPVLGGVVFAIWMALARGAGGPSAIASGLSEWPAAGRVGWLTIRSLAAMVTVPIAEELAFRGFLLRRLISAQFEEVSPREWNVFAVLLSSLAFGLLHGEHWLAGTVAGLVYAAAYWRHGRLGDAIVAHGVTNGLIAAMVLLRGDWYLW
jgi:CAAX prenyl protease-like protein